MTAGQIASFATTTVWIWMIRVPPRAQLRISCLWSNGYADWLTGIWITALLHANWYVCVFHIFSQALIQTNNNKQGRCIFNYYILTFYMLEDAWVVGGGGYDRKRILIFLFFGKWLLSWTLYLLQKRILQNKNSKYSIRSYVSKILGFKYKFKTTRHGERPHLMSYRKTHTHLETYHSLLGQEVSNG